MKRNRIWHLVDTEREVLAHQLLALNNRQWQTPSLCAGLSVQEVLAHMTVSGALNGPRWLAGVLQARFDFDKQVDRRLREQLGSSPAETLSRFASTVRSRTSPPLPALALLGEMVVHGEDIRRPLGLDREYPQETLAALVRYYAGHDQVVVARGRIKGLRLEALDTDFSTGTGPWVRGRTLALIMAMTGRKDYCSELTGPGVATLAARAG